MPAYGTQVPPFSLNAGDSITVWNAEQPATNANSLQVALGPTGATGTPAYISVEVIWAGAAPTGAKVDIYEADTDVTTSYLILGSDLSSWTHNGSVYVGRIDVGPVYANFVRLFMNTAPSYGATTPTVTATINRHA